MEFRQASTTTWVVNIITSIAAAVFTSYLLWQILMPNVSYVAKTVTVRINGANSGSGVIINHQGDRYSVLSNWHVVGQASGKASEKRMQTVQTVDGHKHLALPQTIARVANLDLAILEFRSRSRYPVVAIGNSDRLSEGQSLYVSGWADPSPQLPTFAYQFLVGHLSGRIDKPRDGYALVYTVSALPGMSGGPVLDRRGNLVGIHGRAMTDLRTGTVSSVLGIDINRYLRARGELTDRGWRK
jgi:S1-C subfamily serine protease